MQNPIVDSKHQANSEGKQRAASNAKPNSNSRVVHQETVVMIEPRHIED